MQSLVGFKFNEKKTHTIWKNVDKPINQTEKPRGMEPNKSNGKKIIKIKKRNNKSRNREHELSSVFCGKYMCFKDNIS